MRVALFVPCLVDQFFPQVAEAVVTLLRSKGISVDFPSGQTCCGQPAFNSGYVKDARAVARTYLRAFEGYTHIVTPSGSCAGMVRHYYSELFPPEDKDHARACEIAARTYEFCEFVVHVLKEPDFGATFAHRVTYHPGCHGMRLLGLREEPLTILKHVRGLDLVPLPDAQDCCGFGGAFAVKLASLSTAMAAQKAACVRETQADVLVGTDAGCLTNISGTMTRQGDRVRVLHLAELLIEGIRS